MFGAQETGVAFSHSLMVTILKLLQSAIFIELKQISASKHSSIKFFLYTANAKIPYLFQVLNALPEQSIFCS